jgi:heat shock protein HtpX
LPLTLIYGAYFTDLRTIAAVLLPLVSILSCYGVFRKTTDPKARSWSLGLMLLSSIFLWLFIAVSLALCYALSEAYEYQLLMGVREVFSRALLAAIVAAIPLSALLRIASPRLILLKVKGIHAPEAELAEQFALLAQKIGVPSSELRLSKNKAPLSFAVEAGRPIVVMSETLLSLLKKDELEAVMAHELAHIKNSDTSLKALVTAVRTALPFDPAIRLVEAAFHREREMVADETAAKVTKKPLALASALLKIYEGFPRGSLPSYGTLSILGAGSTLMSRHPQIRNRISQLIRLAETNI